jgi:hypothetical protein
MSMSCHENHDPRDTGQETAFGGLLAQENCQRHAGHGENEKEHHLHTTWHVVLIPA